MILFDNSTSVQTLLMIDSKCSFSSGGYYFMNFDVIKSSLLVGSKYSFTGGDYCLVNSETMNDIGSHFSSFDVKILLF